MGGGCAGWRGQARGPPPRKHSPPGPPLLLTPAPPPGLGLLCCPVLSTLFPQPRPPPSAVSCAGLRPALPPPPLTVHLPAPRCLLLSAPHSCPFQPSNPAVSAPTGPGGPARSEEMELVPAGSRRRGFRCLWDSLLAERARAAAGWRRPSCRQSHGEAGA
uniref:Uncharacterized protein n=1 Tax=Myotis myotis TaxID=51298 RepID=A0A7J7XH54_MYOMY|nr:hypothetical protein mMyoMyo1_011594 [Myotis myotis]